ncbi:MAG: hypothetical protein V1716_00745 [Candidatus Uhrbacteria bacterium]
MNSSEKFGPPQIVTKFDSERSEPGQTKLEQKPESVEAKPRPDLVAKYSLFKEKLQPKADIVYHPCGSNDISPSVVFPDSRVIYVDIDENAVEALKKSGVEAHVASALDFNPGNVDVLILLNPTISPDAPASHVVQGGFILGNDYHNTATNLRGNGQYQLRGIIRKSSDRKLIFDTENTEDYWKEIETEEEFQKAPPSFTTANYETASRIVKAVTGKKENILAEYRKIIEMAKEQNRSLNAKMLAKNPEIAYLLQNPDTATELLFNYKEEQHVLAVGLPRKKGTADDIFVFQKK